MCRHCHELARATFDEFTWRDQRGRTRFANQLQGPVWPVFRREPRKFKNDRHLLPVSACHAKANRAIVKAANVCAARRWIPIDPLTAHVMQVEDAMRAKRSR